MKRSGSQIFLGWIAAGLCAALTAACGNSSSSGDLPEDKQRLYLQKGDSIATEAQKVLMSNVVAAIQAGGVNGAVDFCSEKALPLTDSVSRHFDAPVQRLSDKNRNPVNVIYTVADSLAWQQLRALMPDTLHQQKHLVLQADDGHAYYYKAITIAMPTCLKCHGSPGTDIDPETLLVIQDKYPADKATGYRMGDLRGMWKVRIDGL